MKKIAILLLGMILVINTAMSQRYQGELYAYQTGGDSETWVIEDWSTIYGYYEDGYPIITKALNVVPNRWRGIFEFTQKDRKPADAEPNCV